MNKFDVVYRKLTVNEYQLLRTSTGWDTIDNQTVEKALKNDLFSICVFDSGKPIGMGRVIGDGAIYFYIQDIIVLPEYKNQGVGRLIMNAVEEFIMKEASNNSFIGLMSAVGVSEFYERFGYRPRPDDGPGMYKVIKSSK